MYTTLSSFTGEYRMESASTLKLLRQLTDESLYLNIDGKVRTIGRLAYHIAHTVSEMMSKTGLDIPFALPNPMQDNTVTAAQLAEAYEAVTQRLIAQVEANWTDASLQEKHNLYGEEWANALTLSILLKHEIHHRGQLTVLMRLAGLKVPGIYGPSAEEWEQYGMAMEE